jgi:predicted nucleotidyltransferase
MPSIQTLIASKIRIEILRLLAMDSVGSFNINELSRRIGSTPRGVEKELKNLLSGGILKREIIGNQHRYQFDENCIILPEIKGMIIKTVGAIDLIRNSLESVAKKINRAFIFGSFASGNYGNESDVDLFLVTDLTGLEIAEQIGDLQNELGRAINISQFSIDEFEKRKANRDHFINQVIEGPKIDIIGKSDES